MTDRATESVAERIDFMARGKSPEFQAKMILLWVHVLTSGDTPSTDRYHQIGSLPHRTRGMDHDAVGTRMWRDQEALGGRALAYVDPWPMCGPTAWTNIPDFALSVFRRIMGQPHYGMSS